MEKFFIPKSSSTFIHKKYVGPTGRTRRQADQGRVCECPFAEGLTYTVHIYEGAQHAFHNDTDGPRYNKAAAELSWKRTLDFFNKYLRTS